MPVLDLYKRQVACDLALKIVSLLIRVLKDAMQIVRGVLMVAAIEIPRAKPQAGLTDWFGPLPIGSFPKPGPRIFTAFRCPPPCTVHL